MDRIGPHANRVRPARARRAERGRGGPTRRTRPRRSQPAVPASTSRTPQCGLGSYTFTPKNPHAQVGTPPLPSDK